MNQFVNENFLRTFSYIQGSLCFTLHPIHLFDGMDIFPAKLMCLVKGLKTSFIDRDVINIK